MKSKKSASCGGFHPVSAPDYLPQTQLRQLQLARLKCIVKRAYENVSLHRQRMEEKGITPDDIQSLEDITKLHFTMKDDLREAYPFGMFASPMDEVVRVHASSGTTGKPTVVAYTQEDVNVDQRDGPEFCLRAAATGATSSRTRTGMGCSRVVSARTTAPRPWAPPSSPCRAETPTARS